MDFSPGRDCNLALRTGIVDVAALGTLVDDWPGDHQSDGGLLCAKAAAVRPVAHCFEHDCRRRYPPLCTDSDRHSHAFPLIMLTRRVSIDRRQTFLPESGFSPWTLREHCLPRKISRLFPHFFSRAPIKL